MFSAYDSNADILGCAVFVRVCSREFIKRISQPLLILTFPFVRESRSESAYAKSSATGSFGGVPVSVRVMVSLQNCNRINPIVELDVVSGIMDRDTFNARRAR